MPPSDNISTTAKRPVWLTTGCSTGFGRELARHLLDCGYRVVVTALNPDDLAGLAANGNALVLKLNVTDQDPVDHAIKELRALGYYIATNFSVEGLSDALWQEVEPPGIRVMVVEPGAFRTGWAGHSANEGKQTIDDYAAPVGARRSQIRGGSGKQPGKPLPHNQFFASRMGELRSAVFFAALVAGSLPVVASDGFGQAKTGVENASRVFEAAKGRIYQIRTLTQDGAAENSTGSGFLVGQDGLIATNWHVVSSSVLEPGTYRIEAVRTDGLHIPVSVVAIDSMSDLALLKAGGETGPPFALRRPPLARGDKGFSLGNPKGIGFTVVEGTFNGVEERSFTGHYHFTAPINAGMSGGPALVSSGEVFGINVARRSDGDSMGFLVPAGKLATLIAKPGKTSPTPDALLREATQGMIDGQEKITADIVGALPKTQQIGPFTLPAEPGSASRCNGSSNREEDDGYALESISCLATLPISAGRKHLVGIFATDYRVISNLGLDSVRFVARLSDQFSNDKDDGGDRKILGPYTCRTSFVALKGGTARVSLCTRHYRQLDGLMDAHLRLVTVDSSDVGLVGELTLRGFTESNIKRLARWYLGSIEWKR